MLGVRLGIGGAMSPLFMGPSEGPKRRVLIG